MENQILDENLFEKDNEDGKIGIEIISIQKFLLLSILTFALYPIWWTYKSWNFFKTDQDFSISPALRTIFSIFYTYDLFEKIKKLAWKNGYKVDYNSGMLFAGLILSGLLANVSEAFSYISFLSILIYIPPLQAFNFGIKNSKSYYPIEQSGLNSRQIILVVICSLIWGLAIFGLLTSLGLVPNDMDVQSS